MPDIYLILGAVVSAVVGAIGLYFKGRSDGHVNAALQRLREHEQAERRAQDAATDFDVRGGAADSLRNGRF